jgi:G3E family GTPase
LLTFQKQHRYRSISDPPLSEHRFGSTTLQLDQPVPWPRLQAALENLMIRHADRLLRLKGVVYTTEQPRPVCVQGSAGRLFPPALLPARTSEDNLGRLVFITDGEIKGLLESVTSVL